MIPFEFCTKEKLREMLVSTRAELAEEKEKSAEMEAKLRSNFVIAERFHARLELAREALRATLPLLESDQQSKAGVRYAVLRQVQGALLPVTDIP